MINLRPILLITGSLLLVIAASMLIPAIVDIYYGNEDWMAFVAAAFFTCFIGGVMVFSNQGEVKNFTVKQTFFLTTFSWFAIAIFSTLPFMLSELKMSFTDSFFESMSGLTTTGSTVMVGLDNAPPGILLWRALLNGIGGVGIIVFALAVLPMLRIGGMQLFRSESSDKTDKILPRATQIAGVIGYTYVLLVFLCFAAFWWAGMGPFDAICHSLATIATGGFSTKDASFGYFNSALLDYICVVFMLLGSMPFLLYVQMTQGNFRAFFKDSQVQWFLLITFFCISAVTCWMVMDQAMPFWEALRRVSFNLVSVITTTGFASTDYNQWGSFAVIMFFMCTVMGGCTGSTTGGIKVFRHQVLFETAKAQISRLIQPHGIFLPQFNKKPITDAVTNSVMSFFILFALSFTVLAVLLSLTGLDFITSMSSAAQALSNTGPGLGNIVGPAGNFSTLSDPAKWMLAIGMLIGRLEIFTVLVLFSPYFWRE